MESIWPIVIPIIFLYFLLRTIRLIPENSNCAVVKLGKFVELRGPGLHFKWSGNETQWIKLFTGDRGKLISNGIAKFQDIDLPIVPNNETKIGDFVRIELFSEEGIKVSKDQDQSKSFYCEKCGHENIIK
jgi:hypothetical protein